MREDLLQSKKAVDYWFNKLKTPIDPLRLGVYTNEDRTRIEHKEKLNLAIGKLIDQRSNNKDFSKFILFQAPLFLLGSKLSNSDFIRSLSPALNDNNPNGFLFTEAEISGDMKVKELFRHLQEDLKKAWSQQSAAVAELKTKLEANNCGFEDNFHFGYAYENLAPINETSNFDVQVASEGGNYFITFRAFTQNHNEFVLKELAWSYQELLGAMLQNPEASLGSLSLLSKDQLSHLDAFNETTSNLPFRSLLDYFLEQAEKTPEKIALEDAVCTLTFEQTLRQIQILQNEMVASDVKAGDVVAVCAPRSVLQPLTLLACQSVGAIYLPIDFNNPPDRTNFIVEDANTKLVISSKDFKVDVDASVYQWSLNKSLPEKEYPFEPIAPEAPCYIIYTSGSTGKPKGVVIRHDALGNYIHSIQDRHDEWFAEEDRCLSMANPAFDVALYEYALAFHTGCTLYVLEEERVVNPEKVAECLRNEKIAFCYLPPIYLQEIGEIIANNPQDFVLKKLHVGLEAILDEKLQRFLDALPQLEILNGYGPSEITVGSNYFRVTSQEPKKRVVPIGTAILNTQLFVLDRHGQRAPVGVAGELFVGGIGLAIEYLNRPELTREKFAIHKHIHPHKIYATGDRVVMDKEGNVHFIGRIDNQLKIRGYRVEPGEIEKVLMQHEAVSEALVVAARKDGQLELCAYLVSTETSQTVLREYLGSTLPAYMIPSSWNFIPRIPLTRNGKPDRKNLPEPKFFIESAQVATAETELQKQILASFEAVLHCKMGINDSFFDYGGNSLKAAKLVAHLFDNHKISVPFRSVFQFYTVAGLAASLSADDHSKSIYEIEKAPSLAYYPLSHAQKRMYLTQAVDPKSTIYNMPGAFFINGRVDFERFEDAFLNLIQRHEGLRTRFVQKEGSTVQEIIDKNEFKIEWLSRNEETIEEVLTRFIRPFDLASGNLLRIGCCKWSTDKYLMLIDMHHIVSDGVSASQFLREFDAIYKGKHLKTQAYHYKDFAYWLNNLSESTVQKQEQFWKDQLQGLQPLELPFDKIPAEEDHSRGENFEVHLPAKISEDLFNKAKALKSTPYTLVLSAYQLLISQWANKKDVSIGTVYAGRLNPKMEEVLGMFVNTLPHRLDLSEVDSIDELIEKNNRLRLQIYENQCYPTEDLAEVLEIEVPRHKHPYFQTLFVYQNIEFDEFAFEGLEIEPIASNERVAKFDLTLEVEEKEKAFVLRFNYPASAFQKTTMERLGDGLVTILKKIADNSQLSIGDVSFIPEKEAELMERFSFGEDIPAPPFASIVEAFSSQVLKNGDRICVEDDTTALSYKEVDAKSNQLAALLIESGIAPEECVGILLPRSIDYLICILGIMKAGGCFVPFDVNHPSKRIKNLMNDAGIKKMLANQEQIENRKKDQLELLNLSVLPEKEYKYQLPKGNQLAYVLYTSGSTGQPKGVEIEHASLMHTLWSERDILRLSESTVTLQQTNPVFDVALLEFFLPLLVGGKLFIPNHEKVLDFEYLIPLIKNKKVTNFQGTPSLYRSMIESGVRLEEDHHLSVICVGGESLDPALFKSLRSFVGDRVFIDNHYGPTEASIDVICNQNLRSFNENIIGRPYPNTEIRILNWQDAICGVGTPGELCISSPGLARGYRNDPEKTQKAFKYHQHLGGKRYYHTGDLAKWTKEGEIHFLGRIDDQIKIRGQRVELGEISSQMRSLNGVRYSQVLLHQDGNDKFLVGYYKADRNVAWREELLEILPEAIVPWHFVEVKDWPLTSNGKTDTQKLRRLGQNVLVSKKGEVVLPKNELQSQLLVIWKDLLDRNNLGITDNFFEVGGHSLKATQVISRVHKELKLDLKLADLFQNPTIEGLSKILEKGQAFETEQLKPIEKADSYPLSAAQRRLFVLHQFQEQQSAYNLPAAFKLIGDLNIKALEKAYQQLVDRHEALRTSFHVKDQLPVQVIHDNLKVNIQLERHPTKSPSEIERIAAKDAVDPFDLGKAPLIRLKVLEQQANEFICLFNMHHIISDGWSINILIQELLAFYHAELEGEELRLADLSIQYKDFGAWQNNLLESEAGKKMAAYWMHQFSGEIPMLDLPTDRSRPKIKTNVGTAISFNFNGKLSSEIQAYCQQKEVSPFMFVLALTKVLLYKQSGQKEIVIGTPVAGREQLETENLIGCFVNTLALKSAIPSESLFEQFLQVLKESTLEAFAHQQYPFDRLVDEVVVDRDTSRSPLFDVMVVMENYDETDAQFSGLKMEGIEVERQVSKFDLSFYFKEKTEGLHVLLEYNTDLFDRWRMDSLLEQLQTLASQVIHRPDVPINQLKATSPKDIDTIREFNNTQTAPYPETTLLSKMDEGRASYAGLPALEFQGKIYSHQEAHELSDKIAAGLIDRLKIKANDIVALAIERSEWMPIAILGILKSGAAYLPIDPNTPESRLNFILEDSKAKGLISDLHPNGLRIEDLIQTKSKLPAVSHSAKNLAYVIYTSGSTGAPKGVMIEHGALLNRLNWMLEAYPISTSDVILQKTNYTFDVSVWEMLLWCISGTKLSILNPGGEKDPTEINRAIENGVSVLHFVPSMLSVWLEYLESMTEKPILESLRLVYVSGEALNKNQVDRFQNLFGSRVQLVNKYGPTEAAIDVTHFDCARASEFSAIPIGRPISNIRIYVLNKNLQEQPIGTPGELCIAGDGLARGYLNREDLNRQKFVAAPHLNEEKIYRTGDLVSWLPQGEIAYHGRLDFQVKIRGFRIELGEIEQQLLSMDKVDNAAVITIKDESGQDQVIGYFTGKNTIDVNEITTALGKNLPAYMLPNQLIQLETIPTTANGKLNRKELPLRLDKQFSQEKWSSPIGAAENELAEIWKGLLGLDQVYRENNFFHCGGDSIKAIQLSARLLKMGRSIEIGQIFQYPTLQAMAAAMENGLIDIPQDPLEGALPLSPIQKRFFRKNFENINHYNQAVLLELPDNYEEKTLEKALTLLLQKHDGLRAQFKKQGKEWLQTIVPASEFNFPEIIGRNAALSLTDELLNSWQASLDIEKGKLMNLGVVNHNQRNYLHWVCHHLIIDSVSWRILSEDLAATYTQLALGSSVQLPPRTHSIKDWLNGYNSLLEAGDNDWANFWQEKIAIENLEVPKTKNAKSDSFRVSISPEQTQIIIKDYAGKGYNVNDVLLAALSKSVQHWKGKSSVKILLEGHGRNGHPALNLSQTVGWFTSVYPYELKNEQFWNLSDLLEFHKNQRSLLPHEGASYDFWVDKLDKELNEPEVEFNYLGHLNNATKDRTDFGLAPLDTGLSVAVSNIDRIRLSITAAIAQGILHIQFESRTGVDNEAIGQLASIFEANLQQMLNAFAEVRTFESENQEVLMELEKPFHCLTKGKKQSIFFMPPALGAYFAFREVADQLHDFNVYAANYLNDENRFEKYFNYISKVQPAGELILGGYSGGANLSYELAVYLEQKGRRVSQLIFIDGKCAEKEERFEEKDLEKQVISLIGAPDEKPVHPLLSDPKVRESISAKIKSYDALLYRMVHSTQLAKTTIYQISSEESRSNGIATQGWEKLCEKFIHFNGYGLHREMLQGEHLVKNCEWIVEAINQEITSTKNLLAH
ncbi:non-ribosomal peptide synthetase [Luteibaculum oceani]|uniref:Amino acid adenylation domain-containing protein n=1 Tax=Luteibaculum oceani TaxID=1294296 RepID=A0A5C6V945_9FLAO|nr:non-ribosomal peptide synthetase [Luteibaculum oceani]TXC81942.1 amino acid adenylation domain-containing protein [Luteibaculum oceani]